MEIAVNLQSSLLPCAAPGRSFKLSKTQGNTGGTKTSGFHSETRGVYIGFGSPALFAARRQAKNASWQAGRLEQRFPPAKTGKIPFHYIMSAYCGQA